MKQNQKKNKNDKNYEENFVKIFKIKNLLGQLWRFCEGENLLNFL